MVVEVGNIVRVKNTGARYTTYKTWMDRHIDKGTFPNWVSMFEHSEEKNRIFADRDLEYEVVSVGPHGSHPGLLAALYHEDSDSLFLIGVEVSSLEVVKEHKKYQII